MNFPCRLIFVLVVLLILNSSCKREPYYSCICFYTPKDTSMMSDSLEIYRMGRMTSREAHLACQAYDVPMDTAVNCYVEARK